MNRQENDRGTQYASVIFTHNARQAEIAARVTSELQDIVAAGRIPKFSTKIVSTAIGPASDFIAADIHHQRYLEVNPTGYCEFLEEQSAMCTCSAQTIPCAGNHRKRFAWEDFHA